MRQISSWKKETKRDKMGFVAMTGPFSWQLLGEQHGFRREPNGETNGGTNGEKWETKTHDSGTAWIQAWREVGANRATNTLDGGTTWPYVGDTQEPRGKQVRLMVEQRRFLSGKKRGK